MGITHVGNPHLSIIAGRWLPRLQWACHYQRTATYWYWRRLSCWILPAYCGLTSKIKTAVPTRHTGGYQRHRHKSWSYCLFCCWILLHHYPMTWKTRFQLEQLPKLKHNSWTSIGKNAAVCALADAVIWIKSLKFGCWITRRNDRQNQSWNPAMIEQELVELAVIREEKAAKKKARRKNGKDQTKLNSPQILVIYR